VQQKGRLLALPALRVAVGGVSRPPSQATLGQPEAGH